MAEIRDQTSDNQKFKLKCRTFSNLNHLIVSKDNTNNNTNNNSKNNYNQNNYHKYQSQKLNINYNNNVISIIRSRLDEFIEIKEIGKGNFGKVY